MKITEFRRNIQKFGEDESPTFWCGQDGAILVPSFKKKPEGWAKHMKNEQIEENDIKSKKTIATVPKRFGYLTKGKQAIGFQIGKIHEI